MRLHLDFCVYASWQREILQAIDSLWGGTQDVDKTLVDFHFKSLTTGLVDMWGFDHGESATLGRKWHWPRYASTGADSSIYDLLGTLINHAVIISF